jgi:branched-chain amino acid transport system substrate-binding protein
VFASAVAFAACITTTPGGAFQSENTLRVGAMWAITGGVALTGKGALNLSKLAVEEINAAGGVKVDGKQVKLELHAYDEACKEQEGLALLSRLKDVESCSLSVRPVQAPRSRFSILCKRSSTTRTTKARSFCFLPKPRVSLD